MATQELSLLHLSNRRFIAMLGEAIGDQALEDFLHGAFADAHRGKAKSGSEEEQSGPVHHYRGIEILALVPSDVPMDNLLDADPGLTIATYATADRKTFLNALRAPYHFQATAIHMQHILGLVDTDAETGNYMIGNIPTKSIDSQLILIRNGSAEGTPPSPFDLQIGVDDIKQNPAKPAGILRDRYETQVLNYTQNEVDLVGYALQLNPSDPNTREHLHKIPNVVTAFTIARELAQDNPVRKASSVYNRQGTTARRL